jgi:predicted alpha/beta superfamily hydrolase
VRFTERVAARLFLVLCASLAQACASSSHTNPTPEISTPLPFDASPGIGANTGVTPGAPDAGEDASVGDGTTTVRVHYPPTGHTIALRGAEQPLAWASNTATNVTADGFTWVTRELRTPTDFKPVLDGTRWSLGANYRVKPGESIDIYPRFESTNGSFSVRWANFASPTLGRNRRVWVYLPPGYNENTVARYPVVYMHDGQNLFDRNAAFGCWFADEALDRGAADGSIREAIIVGPEASNARILDYTPSVDRSEGTGGGAGAFVTSIVTELKPLVDRELRTLTGREHTAMIGSSLGGLLSAWVSVHHASTFGLVGAMSPSTWWDSRMILDEVSTLKTSGVRPLRVYLDSGNAGPSLDGYADTALLADRYRGAGFVDDTTFRYLLAPGHQHNESYWSQRLPGALRFVLGPRPHNGALP